MTGVMTEDRSRVESWLRNPPGGGPEWLGRLREEGAERFRRAGFPGPREEAWRFTSLKPVLRHEYAAGEGRGTATPEAVRAATLVPDHALRLVFVDGVYSPELSAGNPAGGAPLAAGLAGVLADHAERVEPHLGRVVRTDRHRFAALNTAFLAGGAFVHVPRNQAPATPVHLLYLATGAEPPSARHLRTLIVLEEGAQAVVLEEHVGPEEGPALVTAVTEVVVGENAGVDHVKLQRQGPGAFHLSATAARVGRHGRYTGHSVSLGARLYRHAVDVVLDGEGGECHLNGLYVTGGRQHADHHTFVDHAAPHTVSRELYKGVLDGRSTAVFNGRILIREGAQQIDSAQTNNNLLLSQEALVNTNPELEIFADDVKARHGATIGQIEEESLFYLRSRGVPYDEARRILIRGFTGEMLERIPVEPVRTGLEAVFEERF